MSDKLTPQQAQAVFDRGGKLLVSAAAGSGKTKVLVDRLMSYLMDPVDPADLDDFLIITYTKAAASELRGKIAAKLSEKIAENPENRHLQKQIQRLFLAKISTVHGFCSDLMREFTYRLDLSPDFRVAEEDECLELRETVLADLLDRAYDQDDRDEDFRAFVDSQGLGRDDRLVPQIVQQVYDSARCHLSPEKWLDDCLAHSDMAGVDDAAQTVWGGYLMRELHRYLDAQIGVLSRCAQEADACPGLEKPAQNLRDTLYQLRLLSDTQSWDQVLSLGKIDYGRLTFPRKCPDIHLADRIKAARNACKKGLEKQLRSFVTPSDQVVKDLEASASGVRGLIRLVRQFGREYDRAKHNRRCVDFGDLEHKTLDLLLGASRSGPTSAAAEIGARFREILVDEYQDSNAVQDAIFTALTHKRQNCFMVGDVKQSIYQFRLADPGIFLEKYQAYGAAGDALPGQGRKVLLSHNFRSGGEIIEAVNHVFFACMSPEVGDLAYTEAEALREGIPHLALPDAAVELYGLDIRQDTYEEEAAFVAERIRRMLDERTPVRSGVELRPVQPDDIVILLRSPGSVGRYYQQALESAGIRCSSGGGTDLLQTQEIGTLRALLQTIYNPRVDIPLVSVLASPVFGFTANDLAAFRAKHRYGCIYDALKHDDSPKSVEFRNLLEQLRLCARTSSLTVLLETCMIRTGMDAVYSAMPGGSVRSENLQTFFQLASDYEHGDHRDLGQFLDYLDSLEKRGLISQGIPTGGSVNIMSIHKSKGLEFPVVFLCGLSRDFNRESTRAQLLCHKELGLGLSVADSGNRVRYPTLAKRAIAVKMTADSLSEELRVLYVAMTRPRDRLVMTYASRNLEGELQDIALRLDLDGGKLLCRDVSCPGQWVLMAAMKRTEAGAFFALGGKPDATQVSNTPWQIAVAEAPEIQVQRLSEENRQNHLPEQTALHLKHALSFRYAHKEATQSPSKQTATGRKGRFRDEEAAENTPEPRAVHRSWRSPSFLERRPNAAERGTAVHAAMQYLPYECCTDEHAIARELDTLVQKGFLTQTQAQLVDCAMLARFFQSEQGRKLRSGIPYLREFKFSILDNGIHYGQGLEEEAVLLQGVVDCAMLEADGITILDFKTDHVTQTSLPDLVDRYAPQVVTYAEALSRIYEMPVKTKYLYFFYLDRFIQL